MLWPYKRIVFLIKTNIMKVNKKIIEKILSFSKKVNKEEIVQGFVTDDYEMFIAFQNNETTYFDGKYFLFKN